MVNELKKLMGKGFRTDVAKVKMFKGYWLQGKIVEVNGTVLTLEVPLYYNSSVVEIVKADIKDVIKVRDIK